MSIFVQQYHINAFDNFGLQEIQTEIIPTLSLSVYDGIGTSESQTSYNPFCVALGFEQTTIQEVISILTDQYHIDVLELFQISETNIVIGLTPETNLSDIFGLIDQPTLLIPQYYGNLSDTLGISESITIFIDKYFMEFSESIKLSEYIRVQIPTGAGATVYYMIWHSPNGPVILVN